MKIFVQRTVELIGYLSGYTDASIVSSSSSSSISIPTDSYCFLDSKLSSSPHYTSYTATASAGGSSGGSASTGTTSGSSDTSGEVVTWPPTHDATLFQILHQFQKALPVNKLSIKQHLSILFVLQLRLECNIYDIRPSDILGKYQNIPLVMNQLVDKNTTNSGSGILSHISLIDTNLCKWKPIMQHVMHPIFNHILDQYPNNSKESYLLLDDQRKRFLRTCFFHLPVTGFSLVFKLVNSLDLDLDQVRLVHISTLLDRCSAEADEIADEVITHVSSSKKILLLIYC